MLNGIALQFVTGFRYLGHLVDNKLSDDDINRELRNLFVRTNILVDAMANALRASNEFYSVLNYVSRLYDVGL